MKQLFAELRLYIKFCSHTRWLTSHHLAMTFPNRYDKTSPDFIFSSELRKKHFSDVMRC